MAGSGDASGGRASVLMAARIVLVGVVLYAAIDTALVFLRPQFSILHNAESDYGSHGSWAWLMDLNFLLRCVLSLAAVRAVSPALSGAAGTSRLALGRSLLVIWALCSGLLAFFADDPVGTPTRWHGRVHLALALIAFLAVLVGAIIVSRVLRDLPQWRAVRIPVAALPWAALIPILLLGHAHLRPQSLGGLYEKVFLGIELLWLACVALPLASQSKQT